VLAVLALALYRRTSPSRLAAKCTGGQDPKVEWRTSDPKPDFVAGHLFQIQPTRTPYVKLADIRTSGNAAYGDKCDHEWGHIHDPVYFAVAHEGANAYFNNPAQTLGPDHVEVVITAVVAHPGPVPLALKERYFPHGRALLIVYVNPGSSAERGDMRPSDLLASFKGVPLSAGRTHEMDAIPMVENEAIEAEVVRGGELVTLHIVRQGGAKTGFSYGEAPILEVTP
jgi:hypothetical protein